MRYKIWDMGKISYQGISGHFYNRDVFDDFRVNSSVIF